MTKYLTLLKTVLIIWMPEWVQDRIAKTQIAWERLKNKKIEKPDWETYKVDVQKEYQALQSPLEQYLRPMPTPAKKKPAKKKVARKKANKPNVTITTASPSGELKTVEADVMVNGPGDYTIKPKRIRRSKAQIEADRQAKVQNNV